MMAATNPVGANKAVPTHGGQDSLAAPAHQVEFLPERIRHQRSRRSRLIRQGYLLVVCVAVMGILTCVRAERIARARGNLARLENSRISLQKQAATTTPLEHRTSDLLIRKRIDEELPSRTDRAAVLAELCRLTPPGIVIISLDLRTSELPAKDSEQPHQPAGLAKSSRNAAAGIVQPVRMVITGLAINDVEAANFTGQLSASMFFEGANMDYTRTIVFHGQSVREFRTSCYLAQPSGQS